MHFQSLSRIEGCFFFFLQSISLSQQLLKMGLNAGDGEESRNPHAFLGRGKLKNGDRLESSRLLGENAHCPIHHCLEIANGCTDREE